MVFKQIWWQNRRHTYTQEKNMKSDNKSGYEIRADLLGQAQGLLEMNIERANQAIHTHNDNYPNDKKCLGNQTIDPDQVIAVARQLNEFVKEN